MNKNKKGKKVNRCVCLTFCNDFFFFISHHQISVVFILLHTIALIGGHSTLGEGVTRGRCSSSCVGSSRGGCRVVKSHGTCQHQLRLCFCKKINKQLIKKINKQLIWKDKKQLNKRINKQLKKFKLLFFWYISKTMWQGATIFTLLTLPILLRYPNSTTA